MGNKSSCLSAHDYRRQVDAGLISPPLLPRITLEPHKYHASFIKSSSSNYERDHPRYDGEPCSHIFPPPLSLSVTSTRSAHYLPAHIPQAQLRPLEEQAAFAYSAFLQAYPEYQRTWITDTLRRSDFTRLDQVGETYVDYMGGAQHPECLVRAHGDFLTRNIMGNTHSVNNR